ncbi:MAG: ABC transporter permease [Caldilineaceae bacterium]|nr:ABC transporter permease [Caldilineaceae bacterium]
MTTAAEARAVPVSFPRRERTLWVDAARRFARNKLSMVALFLALALIIMALFAPWLAPTHYDDQNYSVSWQRPSAQFPLGTDPFGRDLLSRIIYGARISLSVALVVNLVSFVVGMPIGALAGWYGGAIDYVLMRLVDLMSAFPTLLFALLMLSTIGGGLFNIYLALSITSWIGIARLIRGQFLSLREQDYVLAARATGTPTWRILLRHLTPNALAPVIVSLTLGIPAAIMGEAGLSFLGIGVDPPTPSWGKMVSEYLPYIQTNWYLSTFPAIMIALTMYAFTLMGDGLQDALNPQAK